jgi:hypothetical protein
MAYSFYERAPPVGGHYSGREMPNFFISHYFSSIFCPSALLTS